MRFEPGTANIPETFPFQQKEFANVVTVKYCKLILFISVVLLKKIY